VILRGPVAVGTRSAPRTGLRRNDLSWSYLPLSGLTVILAVILRTTRDRAVRRRPEFRPSAFSVRLVRRLADSPGVAFEHVEIAADFRRRAAEQEIVLLNPAISCSFSTSRKISQWLASAISSS